MNESEALKDAVYNFVVHMLLAGHSLNETLITAGRLLDQTAAEAHTDYLEGNA